MFQDIYVLSGSLIWCIQVSIISTRPMGGATFIFVWYFMISLLSAWTHNSGNIPVYTHSYLPWRFNICTSLLLWFTVLCFGCWTSSTHPLERPLQTPAEFRCITGKVLVHCRCGGTARSSAVRIFTGPCLYWLACLIYRQGAGVSPTQSSVSRWTLMWLATLRQNALGSGQLDPRHQSVYSAGTRDAHIQNETCTYIIQQHAGRNIRCACSHAIYTTLVSPGDDVMSNICMKFCSKQQHQSTAFCRINTSNPLIILEI